MESTEENIDQISGQDIFDSATSDTPVEITQETKAEEAPKEEAKAERVRDEKGRFAPKAESEAPAAEPEPKVEARPEPKEEHAIPSWRLKEEADARREALQRAEAAERQAQEFQHRLAQLQAQLEAARPPEQEFPDIFAQPEALPQYFNQVLAQERAKMQAELKSAVANMSLQRAHDKHGELFMEAYKDVTSRGMDDPIRQQVIASPDPGETLVRLYQREKVSSEVGGDIQAYLAKKQEEWMDDPDFQAKVLERARAKASASPTQNIKLPPSLNKATAAAGIDGDTDTSDRGMYRHATR